MADRESTKGEMETSKLLRILLDDDWQVVRISGIHHHFRHPIKSGLLTVPLPRRSLPLETVWRVLKAAELLKRQEPERGRG
jgi:predicted RNA binding protein YcfA (HicA-like mRNA interferase family)